jgi:hypothetical protein
MGLGGKAVCILVWQLVGAKWLSSCSSHLFTTEEEHQYLLDRRLGVSQMDEVVMRKILASLPGIKLWPLVWT